MFMSKDMFDDDAPRASTLIPPARQPTSSISSQSSSSLTHQGSMSQSSNGQSINVNGYDDSGAAVTPAMRKAKMDELRANQLGKRKGRMLVPTTMARQERPMSSSQSLNQSSVVLANSQNSFISSTSRPSLTSNSSQPINPVNQSRPASSYSGFQRTSTFSMAEEETKRESEQQEYRPYTSQSKRASEQLQAAGVSPVFDPTNNQSNNQQSNYSSKERNSTSSPAGEKQRNSLNQSSSVPQSLTPSATPLSIASLSPLALRLFLTSPTPPNQYHQCYIVRNKKGISNRLFPHYECIYENGEKFLMIAKKRSKNKTSNYLISSDRDKTEKSDEEYLGKIRSNFVGTEFSMYDDGQNPDQKPEGLRRSKRAELGVVLYESNILGSKGPRKMTVIAPSVKASKDSRYSQVTHRPASSSPTDSLLAAYQTGANPGNFIALVNKTPKWNDQVGAYVLNFNGRVTMASVKNFQLMIHKDESNESSEDNAEEEERPALQFGRVGKDTFTMDFGFPLSPLQAFAICLSSFDSKLACE